MNPLNKPDLRGTIDRKKRTKQYQPRGTWRTQSSRQANRGEPGYRFLIPARKAQKVMLEWNMASETTTRRGSSTVSFDVNSSPNAVVTVKNRNKREAISMLLEITELAFAASQKIQVRLLLYTEEIADIHMFRKSLLTNFRNSQTENDVYTYSSYAPASDERMLKVTGSSMQSVEFRTREVLGAVDFRAMKAKLRHYSPNEAYDMEYGARWGGYDQPDEDSELDTTVAIPRNRYRTSTPHTRAQEDTFRPPAALTGTGASSATSSATRKLQPPVNRPKKPTVQATVKKPAQPSATAPVGA